MTWPVLDKKVTSFWLITCHWRGKTHRFCHRHLHNAKLVKLTSLWQELKLRYFSVHINFMMVIFTQSCPLDRQLFLKDLLWPYLDWLGIEHIPTFSLRSVIFKGEKGRPGFMVPQFLQPILAERVFVFFHSFLFLSFYISAILIVIVLYQ